MADPSEDKPYPVENPGSGTRSGDEEKTRDRLVVPSSGDARGSVPPQPLLPPVAHPPVANTPVAQPSMAQPAPSVGRPTKKKAKTGKEVAAGAKVVVGQEPGKKRKSASLENLPLRARTCSLCRREFATARALFGHMRSHPRDWSGAFPPPISPRREAKDREPERQDETRQMEDIANSLLNIGQVILRTEKFKGKEGDHTDGRGDRGGNSLTAAIVSGQGIGAVGWMKKDEMAVKSLNYTDDDRRKQIHYQLDLNKEAPVDDEDEDNNDDDKEKTLDATFD